MPKSKKQKPNATLIRLKNDVAKIIREYRKDEHFDDKIGPDEIIIYMEHRGNTILKSIERRLRNIERLVEKKESK